MSIVKELVYYGIRISLICCNVRRNIIALDYNTAVLPTICTIYPINVYINVNMRVSVNEAVI